MLLLLLALSTGPVFGEQIPAGAPDHTHHWKESSHLGDTIYYLCESCGEQEPVRLLQDSISSGFCQVSEYDGNGGKPVDFLFEVSVSSERAANVSITWQWYRCAHADGEAPEPIPGAVSSAYRTEPFPQPEIRYYLCEAEVRFSLDGQSFTLPMRSDLYGAAFTGLPTVYIETASGEIGDVGKEEYVNASLRLVPGLESMDTALSEDIRIKGRGNFSWIQPKKGYNIRFNHRTNLLGMGKAKKWALIPNFSDKTLLRNWYASYLASEVFTSGDWTPRFRFVDLYLDGTYAGNYALVTAITISESRVAVQPIDEITADLNGDGTLSLADGGYILEMDARKQAPVHFTSGHKWPLSFYDPDLEEAPEEISLWIQEQIRELEDTVFFAAGAFEPGGAAGRLIDIPSWVNTYLVNELTKNIDSCNYSSFLYYDPAGQRFHMGPIWDFDLSCGNLTEEYEPEGFGVQKAKWVKPLLKQEAFRRAVRETWEARKSAVLDSVRVAIPAQAESIRVSAELNNLCWPVSDRYGLQNPPGYLERTTWESELDYMTDWLEKRILWLDRQFSEYP